MIYPIAFPSRAPATQRLTLNRRQMVGESPFTFKQQTVHTASQWILEWTWPPMSFASAEATDAWLLSLKGQEGTFRYTPRQAVASGLTGHALAVQGYAYNDTISVAGWAANGATSLRTGQLFQIGDQLLKVIIAGAFADAQGRVTISFEPELRLDYSIGTTVNFTSPTGVFRLASSEGISYTLNPDKLPEFGTIVAREAV